MMHCFRAALRKASRKTSTRRFSKSRIRLEGLEPRLLLYHGPDVHADGSVEVELDETLDQFGFQAAMFQAYEDQVDFSIFDTGASVVTFSATSQFFFQFFGSTGIPIKVPCGAAAEGVGGVLTGHVSQPGLIQADGLHVANLTFDEFGFPIFELAFDPATAAIVPGVQTFVGALIGDVSEGGCPAPASEFLPTITGTPMLNPTADNPNGLAVNIRPQGELLDFSEFPELNGLVLPVPDVRFQQPGLGVPDDPTCTQPNSDGSTRDICTEPVRVAMEFVGFDNHLDPGNSITESYNPVQRHVQLENNTIILRDQVYLFDTGAQLSIISTEAAEAFGLDLDNPEQVISVQGAAGAVHDIPGFTIDRLSVPLASGGNLIFTTVPIYVLDVAPGLLDGILGMNLFNNAAAMLYDPFHPSGPALDLTFFTEHLFGIPGAAVPESEPNDTAATATVLTAAQYGVGEISPPGDSDWWAVENVALGELVFAYVDTQSSTTSRDSTLRVVAGDGMSLIESDADDGPDLSSVVAGAVVSQPGRVYFEVTEPNGGTISQYELYQAVVSPSDSAVESEGNDSTADADPILKSIMAGSVAPGSGDLDFFSFVATKGSRIVVIMDNDSDGDALATHTNISVLDPNGNVLQFGDNTAGADGNAAGAIVSAPSAGTYFVRVANGGGGGDDDYQFVVLVLDGGDPFAGAVLMFNVLHAQAQAERTVDNCLTDILNCDLDALLGSLDFLLNVTPVLAFAGSIGVGLLPVGFDNLTMTSSVQTLNKAEDLLLDCLLNPNCDFDALLDQLNTLISEDLTPASVQMINGGRLPAFVLPDTIAPVVTLAAPALTNDATPTVTVTAHDENGLPSGTAVRLDADLTGDGDFNDAAELNYQLTTLTSSPLQFDVVPALPEGTRRLRVRVSDAAGNEGISTTQVVIVDLTAPVLSNMPANQSVEATSAAGATATYSPPSATDGLDPDPIVNCTPASGSTFALGVTPVACTATDDAGNLSSAEFNMTVRDTTPPVIAAHGDEMAEATGPQGAAVSYAVPGTSDAVDGTGIATCTLASGSLFPLGPSTVTCNATDAAGNQATPTTFTVTVRDTTPPVIAAHGNETAEATSPQGAAVSYAVPGTSDAVDGAGTATCALASDSVFPLGPSTVTCNATDAAGNQATPTTFTVTVRDTTPPLIAAHGNETAEATSPQGAVVNYTVPGTSDVVSGAGTANCALVSGVFPLGPSTVTCNATDAAGNQATPTTFTVTVRDTTPPVIAAHGNETAEATSPQGAVVNYTVPGTSDVVSGAGTATCTLASGSVFPLGPSTVTCNATDAAGNQATTTFTVTVRDTTPPVITAHGNETVEATSPQGAVVNYTVPGTSDVVNGAGTATCTLASGSVFPLGPSTVTCNATDAAGNQATPTTFTVTVRDTTPPVITAHGNETAEATGPSGAVVNYLIPTTLDVVSGAGTATCDRPPGSFPLGVTEVECNATDTAGNNATPTRFTVTVTAATRIDFSSGLLTIVGTADDDTIRLVKAGRGFLVQTSFGDLVIPTRKSLTRVVVQARSGNDTINLALLSGAQSAQVHGGSGDDVITTGGGSDILLGELGNDQLIGNQGDNLLVGGDGADRLSGSKGGDILIGDMLDESGAAIDLTATLAAWRAGRTPAARQSAVQQIIDRLLDDNRSDVFSGGSGADLFAAGMLDQIGDAKSADACVDGSVLPAVFVRCS